MAMNQESIQQLLQSSDYSLPVPTIQIGDLVISTGVLVITLVFDVIFALLWYFLGIFDIAPYAPWVFIVYIILDIYNILNDATTTDISVSEAYNEIQDEVIRVQGIIGVIVIVYGVALLATEIDSSRRERAMKILTYSLILMCFSLITYATPNSSRYIRNIRLIKERLSNQAIFLFILALLILLIG